MDPKIIRTWLSGPYIIQITKAFYKIHKDQEAVKIQECTQVSQIRTFSVSNTVRCHCLWGSISILLILLLTVGIRPTTQRATMCEPSTVLPSTHPRWSRSWVKTLLSPLCSFLRLKMMEATLNKFWYYIWVLLIFLLSKMQQFFTFLFCNLWEE